MRIPLFHRADSIARLPSCGFLRVDSVVVDWIVGFYPASAVFYEAGVRQQRPIVIEERGSIVQN